MTAENHSRLKVTVEDLDTGETEVRVIEDDWTAVIGAPYELSGVQTYANGTAVVTIKKGKR